MSRDGHSEAVGIRARLLALAEETAALRARLAELETARPAGDTGEPPITKESGNEEKIALFRSLFRGRDDLFPRRWESSRSGRSGYAPACGNEWNPGLCGKPRVRCGDCPNQAFTPVTDAVIEGHLRGRHTIGIYPMLTDGTCRFLVADFDGEHWQRDAAAYVAACRSRHVPVALERSRSGNGGHAWIFFSEPVPAGLARRLGARSLTIAMERNPDCGLRSYDRFFPSQDTIPAGGFGNLIALPLQRGCRDSGNSVFLDESFEPHPDQWAYLASLRRLSLAEVAALAGDADRQETGLLMSYQDDDPEPWSAPPSRRRPEPVIRGRLPERITAVLSDEIYVPRSGLPPGLVNRLVRLAAFGNPDFYRAQAARRSTRDIPRIIDCATLGTQYIALPRGCPDAMERMLEPLGIGLDLRDERMPGGPLETRFLGTLTPRQTDAARALLAHDIGVLAAATGFGKTVVGAHMIAARGVNTLVVVHRRQLMDQWKAALGAFLDLPLRAIGEIGGGKRTPGGAVDIAMIQSLVKKTVADDIIGAYGHLVVDECHHVPAVNFEAVARRTKARYVLGLSATVSRRDGHHPIIFMQCGPVRFRITEAEQARSRPFGYRALVHLTNFRPEPGTEDARVPIQTVYSALAEDEARNGLILGHVEAAVKSGRSPILLTERRDHAQHLACRLRQSIGNVVLLVGGATARQRATTKRLLEAIPDDEERVLVATGRYAGEGLDDPRLDTLFLALPVAWKGTLAQYVGRLNRLYGQKAEVQVHDYVDGSVPALLRMSEKRMRAYRNLGYSVERVRKPEDAGSGVAPTAGADAPGN